MKFPLLAGPGAASTNEPVFSRPARTRFSLPEKPREGIPRSPYFVSDAYRKLFAASCTHLQSLQCIQGSFDFAPFSEVASLLYQGPWTAERYAVAGKLIEQNAMGVDAVVAEVISAGKSFSAVDAFNALYRLRELEAQTQPVWDEFDVLIVPTSPNLPTYAETCAAPASIPLAVVGAHLRGMPLHHQLTARG